MGRTSCLQMVAALAAVGLLAGCAPSGQAGAASEQTTAARPSAASTPAAVRTAPVACDALAAPGDVAALVGGQGDLRALDHLQPGSLAAQSPWSVLNADGTLCGWGGLGSLITEQGIPYVFLEAVPGLSSTWDRLAAVAAPTAGSHYDGAVSLGGRCDTGGTVGFCTTNVLVGDTWFSVEARSDGRAAFTERAFHAFVQGVVTRYASLPAPTPIPTVARDCAAPRLKDAVSAALGASREQADDPPPFALEEAQVMSGQATLCGFVDDKDPDHGWSAAVSVLGGVGPDLFARFRAGVDHPGATAVDVSGLPETATALIEPTEDSTRITVDVLNGGTWLEISTYGTSDTSAVVAAAKQVIASGWLG